MKFFWVNVGTTYREVEEQGFLWAPISGKSKASTERRFKHWDNVSTVRRGDLIFCAYDQHVQFVATASRDAYRAPRPEGRSFGEWDAEGNRVDVALTKPIRPIHRNEISLEFSERFNAQCSPIVFTVAGTLSQIYMASIPPEAGLFLLDSTQTTNTFIDCLISDGARKESMSKTTREAIIQARIGQGGFRERLLTHWKNCCALTGIENPCLLVASHIQPWSESDNSSRLDVYNGLMLAAHVDRLFDQGLMSFDDSGKVLYSDRLSPTDLTALGLDRFKAIKGLNRSHIPYLAHHRKRHGFF